MADNNFRSYRGRDPLAPGRADASAPGTTDDPLAELARLIGEREPMDQVEVPEEHYEQPDDQRYADPDYDEPPRRADPAPPYRPALPARNEDYAPPAGQFAAPAPRFNGAREDARGYRPVDQVRYRDEQEPDLVGRPLPAFLPRSHDDRYQYEEDEPDESDDQYAMEDYEEEAPNGRRRGGFVVIAAVLGLAVLGTAGAFAYRAMFGDSMLPSLPPIIKAEDGPNKIMPNVGNAQGMSGQADANSADSGEKVVPREETPVNMPAPANAAPSNAPRVVSTIPIFPDPTPGPPSGLPLGTAAPPVAPVPAINAQAPAAPGQIAQQVSPQSALGISNPAGGSAPALMPSASAVPGAKKIHTIAIRPDQMGGPDTSAAPAQPAAPAAPAPAAPPRPVVQHAPKPAAAPAPQADSNAPLSIVPTQGGQLAPVPARSAPARPTTLATAASEPAPAAGGGYAVQVSSQRSEADAQTSFRALQAKFPDQLGGRQPIVRRADLGDKGVYYRALVGPFASAEQAAGVCSSLKAAGGTCIVQKI